MSPIRNILFPVDFTSHCRAVAPAVAVWARRFKARLTLLHATDMPPGAYADWYAFLNLMDMNEYHQHARAHLHRFLAEELNGIDVERILVDGPAGPAIVEHAANERTDLIMMPTRGMNRFRTLLLGGVTSHVLHDAHCPVWTEAHMEAEDKVPLECRSVLCAVDLGHATVAALQAASAVASAFSATLHVVHACGDSAPDRHKAMERFSVLAAEAASAATLELLEGDPASAIHNAAAARNVDLVVIGRGRIQGPLGRLRGHAHAIIRTSPCPVLSV
jgi:nucleotide-binding universal stress UspA family protein